MSAVARTAPAPAPNTFSFDEFDEDDDGGWQDMPVIREDLDVVSGLDEEDRKKYHYVSSDSNKKNTQNATGNLIDFDYEGTEWRSKIETDVSENEYTRLRVYEDESDAADEMQLRTKYLFDEDQAMTPLAQMATTKRLLTEAQRIAYVGVCHLTIREISNALQPRLDARGKPRKEDKVLNEARKNLELWALKIMGRLYYHMELEIQEQKMIESLGQHGVLVADLVPALMTTHKVENPQYDPEEARIHEEEMEQQRIAKEKEETAAPQTLPEEEDSDDGKTLTDEPPTPTLPKPPASPTTPKTPGQPPKSPKTPIPNAPGAPSMHQTTTQILPSTTAAVPGVSTTLNSYESHVTLDIRWTLLCDLFLVLTADSVYDARSRVLLEKVANYLGLGWLDLVRFEGRVTEALEIEEEVERERLGEGKQSDVLERSVKKNRSKRYMMLGLATIGGGLVIGLSAGLLAPVIGAGLAAAFGTVGITGTSAFLAGTGGAAVITTGGVLTGSSIAARGMVRRTQQVRTFDILPLHNNKRVSCVLTVPGFLQGPLDDPRLPFSVLDPVVGDVLSVLWEPEMIRETGGALKILTGEVLSQIGQTVLQATVMTALMSALQWPIILTKLGYLIDNPWSNALDRAKAAGLVLADVLIQRQLGVRPVTLIGFSLGARVIWYALLELARQKGYGVVQDVFLLGTTVSASADKWILTRSVVSGRYVNAFARNDWVLNYLFRASSGGIGTVAGLRPVDDVPGLENVDVTDKIAGHMSYRTFMPLILDQLGFPVERDYFDDPVEPDFEEERIVVSPEQEEAMKKKKGWFTKGKANARPQSISKPPSGFNLPPRKSESPSLEGDDSIPREITAEATTKPSEEPPAVSKEEQEEEAAFKDVPRVAGFDLGAIKAAVAEAKEGAPQEPSKGSKMMSPVEMPVPPPSSNRSESTPPSIVSQDSDDDSAEDGRKTPTSLAPAFNRSLSLEDTTLPSNKTSGPGSVAFGSVNGGVEPSWTDNPFTSTIPAPSSAVEMNPFASSSTTSLGGTTAWGSSFDPRPHSGSLAFDSGSGTGMTFGGADRSVNTMSFGGVDGKISSNSVVTDDPWRIPPLPSAGKKETGNGNPWG